MLIEGHRRRAADPEQSDEARARYAERAAQAKHLLQWMTELLALVPEPSLAPLGQWLDAAVAFVKTFARKSSELDGEAAVALTEALADLRALGDLARPASDALALIRSRVDGLTVGGDRARPGHLHVTTLADAGHAGRPNTFVIGLEEGGVFPALVEDPVLLDSERRGIDQSLRTSEDRAGEALYRIVARLGSLSGHVCLSYSCRDLRQARATFPSWVLLQAVRVLKPGETWTYERLADELGEPVSAVPAEASQALCDAGWWLAGLREADASAVAPVREAFPALEQGALAEAARASDVFTEYDGLVPEAGPLLDPRVSGAVVSPTSLEELAKCPFRYFLQRGLGLDPVEDAEPDPDVWLDPMTRGTILHDLFAIIMRELRAQAETPDPARHGARLRELGLAALATHRALVPPPSDGVYEREERELLNDLALFLKFESEDCNGRRPLGFEVALRRRDRGRDARPARAGHHRPRRRAPLQAARPHRPHRQAGRWHLRGRGLQDRRRVSARWARRHVRGRPAAPARALRAGRRRAAAPDRRAGPCGRLATTSPPDAAAASARSAPASTQAQAAEVLRDLFDLLAAGAFVHTPAEDDDCRFCEFGRACGQQAAERAQAKIGQAENAALEAYRKLSAHG